MKDCENKEAAYEVLDFLLKDENVQSYRMNRKRFLVRKEILNLLQHLME